MNLRVKLVLIGAAVSASMMAFSPDNGAGSRAGRRLLGFQTMYGVEGAFLGASSAGSKRVGDERPWRVSEAQGSIDAAGYVHATIRGLVLANDPAVPPRKRGRNDQPRFRLVLSCLTQDEDGVLVSTQISTRGFPATDRGDCEIDDSLRLPEPCVAPVLYVTGMDEGVWLAMSGG